MAHKNCDERRAAVAKVLASGVEIKGREEKVLSVMFDCHSSAIRSDVRLLSTADEKADALRATLAPYQDSAHVVKTRQIES